MINIVLEGDSIPEGYLLNSWEDLGSQLEAYLGTGYTVTNIADVSDTLVEIDDTYATGGQGGSIGEQYNVSAEENILILWAGGNDIYFLAGQEQSAKNAFDSIVSKAITTGYDKIYIMNIIQRGASTAGTIATWRTEAENINNHFFAANATTSKVRFYDVKSNYDSYDWTIDPWVSASASVRSEYVDWAHPTAASQAATALLLGAVIVNDESNLMKTTVDGTSELVYSAYNGKPFSLDGINYYKGVANDNAVSVAAIGLTSY